MRSADLLFVLIRLVLLVVFAGAVGTFTGMIEPKQWLDQIPRVPTAAVDSKEEYLRLVEGHFDRVQPLSEGFFNSCNPAADTREVCSVLADQTLKALYGFQGDLERAKAPEELAGADAAMKRFVARGIEGFQLVKRAALTNKRADWNRARDALGEASTLLDDAGALLFAAS